MNIFKAEVMKDLKDWKKIGKDEWKHKSKNRLFIKVDNYDFYHPKRKGKYRCLVYDGVKKEPKNI